MVTEDQTHDADERRPASQPPEHRPGPAVCPEAGDPADRKVLDYRVLYLQAAGQRNALLIEVKSLKSHIVLLEQENAKIQHSLAQALEALKSREQELERFATELTGSPASIGNFPGRVRRKVKRIANRLVMAVLRRREGRPLRNASDRNGTLPEAEAECVVPLC